MPQTESFSWSDGVELYASKDGDGRTVCAVCVPFNVSPADGRKVAFLPGSFKRTIAGGRQTQIPFYGLHPSPFSDELPVGKSLQLRETDDGLYGEFRISNTTRGNEVLQLVNDGVLHSVSVGVIPVQSKSTDGVQQYQEVKLDHVAVLPDPAFPAAQVTEIHKHQTPSGMTLDVAKRRLAVIRANTLPELRR